MTTPVYPTQREATDPRDYMRLFLRRGWILIACLVLIPVGVYEYTSSRPKLFQASTILQVQSGPDLTGAVTSDFSAPASNLQAVAGFVSTSAVREEAARRLGPSAVLGTATATADEDTGFLTIAATAPTAQLAVRTANAYAAALNTTRQKRNIERVNEAVTTTQAALNATPKADTVTRTQLTSQLQRLQTLRQAQAQNVQVLQAATGASQIAPHPRRNATVALLLAALVGVGLMLLSERLDRRIRKPEDLEALTGLPYLATIPHEAFPGTDEDPSVGEAFQTLRNTLTYFNTDEPLRSLVVASGLKGEGKTTVAAKLALAYAAFGKRVILVDTDLRKPDLANRLGLDDRTGLTQVLVGNTTVEAAFREIAPYGTGLRVLPAGPIPPNPSALLGSHRMASLIQELMADADIVILDTTPLLAVSDAFPLLDKVSGVLALTRLDQTPRDAIRRMGQIMTSAGAQVLGFVATDAKHGRLTGYGYGYGYGYGAREKQSAESAAAGENPGDGQLPDPDRGPAVQT